MRKLFFETEHLIVYHPDECDTENLVAIQADAEVMRYFGGPRSREAALQKIAYFLDHDHQYGFSVGVAFHKETQEFVGRIGLVHFELNNTNSEIEVAIILHKPFWGSGLASEGMQGLLDWAFQNLDVDYLLAVCNLENIRSIKLMQKVGFANPVEIQYFGSPGLKFTLEKSKFLGHEK